MKYLLERLLWLPIVLWAVATLTFIALRLVPGDPIDSVATQNMTVEQVAQYRAEWGLDQPLWQQYLSFLGNLARGDLGVSMSSAVPLTRLLFERVPPTIELAVVGLLISTLLGVGAGLIASVTRSAWVDNSVRALALVGLSVPWFWIAIMLIIVFSVRLGWTPVGGRIGAGVSYETITNFMLIDLVLTGNWTALGSFLRHLALPALAIGLASAGYIARMTRATMREVLGQEYIRSARARGLHERTLVVVHALRNALLPVLTLIGLQFGTLLGGAVITEIVFAWPGVGRLLLDSILRRDYPVVQATVMVVAFCYVVVNLAVDLLYHVVDPRLRRA
jgi:peptide/nickel transport system permease protein